jgi:hypothetical protein
MLPTKVVALVLFLLIPSTASTALQPKGNYSEAATHDDAIVDWKNQHSPTILPFTSPSPAEYVKASEEGKDVLRTKILLNSSTTLEFRELPKDIDSFDSTISILRQGHTAQTYNIGEMLDQSLILAHVGIVPLENGGLLICEYEGGFSGAVNVGFAILRYSSGGIDLHTLPLARAGRVVVSRSKPDQVVIWSAVEPFIGAKTSPQRYNIRTCRLQNDGYKCSPPIQKPGLFAFPPYPNLE